MNINEFILNENNIDEFKDFLKKQSGWIYIAKTKTHNYYKIGHTKNSPLDREKSLSNTSSPNNYEIFFALKFFDRLSAEKNIFKELKSFRYNKEFFTISEEKARETIANIWKKEREILNKKININLDDLIDDFDLITTIHIRKNNYGKKTKIRNT